MTGDYRVGWMLLFVLVVGAVAGYFIHPDSLPCSESENLKEQLEDAKEREALQIVRNKELESKVDSLSQLKPIRDEGYKDIEEVHADRDVLPFSITDTSARYEFFARRFPHLFTHKGY